MKNTMCKSFSGLTPADGRGGLRNPERGWRFEIGVGKIDSDPQKFTHVTDHWPFARFAYDGVTVAQAYCYLSQYSDRPVAAEKIDALERDFARARKDGVKFLLRFAYEFDGYEKGPTAERIAAHIDQLTDVVRRNLDVIYVLQCGWIGLWGEFHTSIHGLEKDPEAVKTVIAKTLAMLPPGRFTMMRREQYKINVLRSLGDDREITPGTAFSNAPHARIGFFNDGSLANYWDGGTFVEPTYASAGNVEFDRVAREGAFMPVDGELFWTGQYNDPKDAPGPVAVARFLAHHYTTFSLVHGFSELDRDPQKWTIDTWKEQIITPAELDRLGAPYQKEYFDGASRTAFEYIRDHLGYRLGILNAEFDVHARPGERFQVCAELENTGFVTPINPREIFFTLTAPDGKTVELATGFDCRALQPRVYGQPDAPRPVYKIATASALPRDLAAGTYALSIWLPDPMPSLRLRSEYAIRLASAIPVETVGGRLLHRLGSVTVEA